MKSISKFLWAAVLVSVATLGCDTTDTTGPGRGSADEPNNLTGDYMWTFLNTWDQGAAQGYPAVQLEWELPSDHEGEPFRVYSSYGGGSYGLIATVTSCSGGVCQYVDTNVAYGRSYDYYIVTYDERRDRELATSETVRVSVPELPGLATPAITRVTGLDDAAFVEWASTGAQAYVLVAEGEDGATFVIGETDGTSYLDDRAENGVRYRYYVSGRDAEGHVSGLSTGAQAIPRPDFHSDIVYAQQDSLAASGFRFVSDEDSNPIVSGGSTSAQWRLEASNGSLRIVPLGQTSITAGVFTTELTCGPGSDATCEDIRVAPSSSQFGTSSVGVETGHTYVLEVRGSEDNRIHHAKLRVQGAGVNSAGRRLIVFDWAYQLLPEEPSLNRTAR